jgi:hypothetical protein
LGKVAIISPVLEPDSVDAGIVAIVSPVFELTILIFSIQAMEVEKTILEVEEMTTV